MSDAKKNLTAALAAAQDVMSVDAKSYLEASFMLGGAGIRTSLNLGMHTVDLDDQGVNVIVDRDTEDFTPKELAEMVTELSLVSDVAKALNAYTGTAAARADLLELVAIAPARGRDVQRVFVTMRDTLGVSREDVESKTGMRAETLRLIEDGEVQVSRGDMSAVTVTIMKAAGVS